MLEQKLLLKYKKLILSECPECSKVMDFSTDCKHNCFQKVIRAQKYINGGVPLKYIDLDISLFTKHHADKSVNIQVKRNEIYTNICNFVNNLDKNLNLGKGVLLTGGFGTGKSTLSLNIAKSAIDKNAKVKVREFSEMVRISQTGLSLEDSTPSDILQEFINCDLYCIENLDWVYSKNNSDYVKMFFDNIVSLALKYSTSIVITSNMGIKDIKNEFNEHVFSVLHEICDIYNVPGSDIRQFKK
ncbi:MAG: ATP-binding protein [Staphylococcus sp.]|nr:ATP-binding protein [Staphylococcus sp.]